MSGNGRDPKSIQKYLDSQNIPYTQLVDPEQTHRDHIVLVSPPSYEDLRDVKDCDGLLVEDTGVCLTVISADCAPIIYADLKKNMVGISHNGRKSTEKQLASKMIQKMEESGSRKNDLRVAIGPAIGACCYPVNLIEENIKQLRTAGLTKDQIDFFPFCTKCDRGRFFSYRGSADKVDFEEQFSFIVYAE